MKGHRHDSTNLKSLLNVSIVVYDFSCTLFTFLPGWPLNNNYIFIEWGNLNARTVFTDKKSDLRQ